MAVAAPTFAGNNGKTLGNTKKVEKHEKVRIQSEFRYTLGDDEEDEDEDEDHDKLFEGLPFGLSKREVLPYGLAKREFLPFGLAKRIEDVIQDDLSNAEADALIAQANALIAEGNATFDLFEESGFTTELTALTNAMDAVEDEINALEDAIDNLVEGEELSTEALVSAYHDLEDAIVAFDSLTMNAASIAALQTQIDAIQTMLDEAIFGQVQGAYPASAALALTNYMTTVETAIASPVSYIQFVAFTTNLDALANDFLEKQYATQAQIVAYNTTLAGYSAELDAWFTAGLVGDTDISVYTLAVANYKALVDDTTVELETALVEASDLVDRITAITDAREALFPAE